MASRPKQDSAAKEKRGKSPSNLRHTTDPAAHRTRTSPHPPPDHQKPNSTNVPNYLRPTASSRPDASKSSPTHKKPSLNITVENTAQKANIHRRRSLDNKPPSTSQLFKSQPTSSDNKPNSTHHHSPTSNIVKPKPPSAFTKPLPEKVAKAFGKDAGKSNPLYSRPVKTIKKSIPNSTAGNSSAATKKQKSAGGNASATKSRLTIDKETKQEPAQEDGDHKSLLSEYEDETSPVEDKDHLDDAQHYEGESDHQSEDIKESDEEMKKLPDPFMACEEQKTATAPASEEPNGAAATTEKEESEPEELHIDGPQIEDKVEEDDKQKNAHENHHQHQQKESFESESMDGIGNVEKRKSEETEVHPIENVVEKEEADGEGNTENKFEHETQEDEVESEEKKENTKVKEEEVNKAKVGVKEENPDVKEETTEVKERNPEVKDQMTYIEERKPDVKEDNAEVEVEKSEVKEEKPEVKEEEQEEEEEEEQKSEECEEKPKAKEERQLNEGVNEEKSQVKGEDLMQKKTVWRTTSGQLGNNNSNSNSNAYNNVIEETASKLKEQRKNKVLALVGAFETVISLEDPDSETPRGN